MNIAALNVKIGADLADFNRGLDAVGAKFNQVGNNLKSSASNLTASVDRSFKQLSESAKSNVARANSSLNNLADKFNDTKNSLSGISRLGEGMQSVGTGLTIGVTAPIVALGAASLKTYGDIQALKLGLEAVTGSSEEAGKQFERLR